MFTAFTNFQIKSKEIYVQTKLEEQNKWITNLNESQRNYIDAITAYNMALMRYSVNEITTFEISKKLIETNKAHNNLIFYIYQSEFSTPLIKDIEKITREITETINKQRKATLEYKVEKIKKTDLKEIASECEANIGSKNYELSEKLGILIRIEKKELTNKTKNQIIKWIKEKLKRTTNGQ